MQEAGREEKFQELLWNRLGHRSEIQSVWESEKEDKPHRLDEEAAKNTQELCMAARIPSNNPNQQGSGNAQNIFGPNARQEQPTITNRHSEQKDTSPAVSAIAHNILGSNAQPRGFVQPPPENSFQRIQGPHVPPRNNQDRVPVGHGHEQAAIPQPPQNSSPPTVITITVQNPAANPPVQTVSMTVPALLSAPPLTPLPPAVASTSNATPQQTQQPSRPNPNNSDREPVGDPRRRV